MDEAEVREQALFDQRMERGRRSREVGRAARALLLAFDNDGTVIVGGDIWEAIRALRQALEAQDAPNKAAV